MARVLLSHITKRYSGDVLAVDDFNLEIRDQEFIVLVGPSGCGKTTTLRMVAGLEEITAGELFIGDRLVNRVPPKDRDIAMVFQNYALYPHMSVFDNMAFGLQLRKMPKPEIRKRVEEAANILDIAHLLERKPKALSGGQRQRVAMGRAIVRNPQVFLFDEPLSNLDAKLRVQMRVEISRLHRRLGRTIIYVTHDQVEAMTLADRIVIMNDGVLQQAGSPIEVFDAPVNMFVAGFIGSPGMNFVDGTVTSEGGQLVFTAPGLRLQLGDDLQGRIDPAAETVRVGFRPQYVVLADGARAGTSRIEAEVEFVEHMGAEKFLYANAGDNRIIVRVEGGASVAAGDSIVATVDSDRVHVFDAAGRNVRFVS